MTYGLNESGDRIHIDDANENEKYICPLCKTELIKKRGDIMRWHFAHKSLFDCDTWAEMSEWHLEWQGMFKSKHIEIPIIESTKRHRADVKCGNIIIEFQHSSLSGRDFEERIKFYSRHGFLIWVFDVRNKEIDERRKFENKWDDVSGEYKVVNVPIEGNFKWLYAYKFNGLVYKEQLNGFDMFLEIADDLLIKVKWSSQWGWKYFGGDYYDIDDFKDHVTKRVKEYRGYKFLPDDFRKD